MTLTADNQSVVVVALICATVCYCTNLAIRNNYTLTTKYDKLSLSIQSPDDRFKNNDAA